MQQIRLKKYFDLHYASTFDGEFGGIGDTKEEALNNLLSQIQAAISDLNEVVDEIQELKKCTKSS